MFSHELRGQLRMYTRSRELAFFTFLLPLILFVLLGSAYGEDTINGDRGANFLEAGMLGYGLVSTAFAGLAIFMVIRRESGILKRVRATPLPASTYFAAVLTSDADRVRRLTRRVHARDRPRLLFFGAVCPTRWLSLVLTLWLGAAAFAALGLGMTAAVRSAEGASATVNAVYLPMAFISGAFFSPHSFPSFLRAIADVLPLTYFIRLTRDVMLHGHQIWDNGADVAVIVALGRDRGGRSRSGDSAGSLPRVRPGRLRVTTPDVLTVISEASAGSRGAEDQLRRVRGPQRDACRDRPSSRACCCRSSAT